MLKQYADHWALVTGASSGIGMEFARALAARGMHLVLTARRRDELEALAEELHTRHGTRSLIIPGDLADPDFPQQLISETKRQKIAIELLVNNAGFGMADTIENTDRERVLEMLQVNMSALTNLTYLALPDLLERGHGAVLNVSSISAFQPVAYMPAYSASKAYILHFSEALWAEARSRGVTVMALCPGVTTTNFFEIAGVGGWLKKHRAHAPDYVVRIALKSLDKRRQYVVPGIRNYLLSLASRIASRRTVVQGSMKYFRPRKKKKSDDK
ncbi:Sulfoacetaldehyde reductase [Polystyrenella longa]|uniref:Sulfoacetaldehyde reductase n=1 Tax=Polystyrenella longa TaxID=2528007 RepID=A0A518CSE8_9PLAN|nr:SDR family oxidoreductase [Polystyrenella longa]QDU82157.1 Sulfoacetaldehyde reductase [Polystyrenella longa]